MSAPLPSRPDVERDAQAVLTIDLDALGANWRDLAARAAPAECGAAIKADAYGLGIAAAAPALAQSPAPVTPTKPGAMAPAAPTAPVKPSAPVAGSPNAAKGALLDLNSA